MKVWLDDKRPMPEGWDVHVKTAQEAIALVSTGTVTHIGLDHDLGPVEETGAGSDVAKFIQGCAMHNTIPRIFWSLQTDNGPEKKSMGQVLRRADEFWDAHEEKADTWRDGWSNH